MPRFAPPPPEFSSSLTVGEALLLSLAIEMEQNRAGHPAARK